MGRLRITGPAVLLAVLSLAAAPQAEALPGIVSATLDADGVLLTIVFDDTVDASGIDPSKIHVRDGGALSGGATFAGGLLFSAESDTVRLAVPPGARATVSGYAAPTLHFDAGALEKGGEDFPPAFAFPQEEAVTSFLFTEEGTPQGLAFSPDGTLMFVVGSDQDAVFRYGLDPPYDVTSAAPAGSYSVQSEEGDPRGLAFSHDGTSMFVSGGTNFVYRYSLGTPFGFEPAPELDGSLDVGASDAQVTGLDFGDGGTRMYISGDQGNGIHQYDLPAPYNITGAARAGSYNVGGEDGGPRGVAVSEDGRTMLVLGQGTDRIYRYYLGGAFDVGTAMLVESMQVAETENNPRGLAASGDGRIVFVTGSNDERVYAHNLGDPYDLAGSSHIPGGDIRIAGEGNPSGVAFTPDGTVMLVVGNSRDLVYRYELPRPYDTGGGVLDGVSSTAPARTPDGIAFSNDGSVMLIVDRRGADVYMYDLAEPYAPANETHSSTLSVAAHEENPTGIALASDGSAVFVIGHQTDSVYRFDLGGSLDLGSAVHSASFDAGPYVTGPTGIALSADGHRLFISERVTNLVHRFEMAIPYDIAAAAYVDSLDVSGQDDILLDIAFAADGSAMFAAGARNDMVYAYALGSGYDITPSAGIISVPAEDPSGLALSENGAIMALASGGDIISGFTLGSPYGLHTAIPSEIPAPPGEGDLSGVAISDDGRYMYAIGGDLLTVYRYTMNPPHDIASATLGAQSFSLPGGISPAPGAPTGLDISDDGRHLYVPDENGVVYRFDLESPHRLDGGTFGSSVYVGSDVAAPRGVYVAPGGSLMLVSDSADGTIHRYELASPYEPAGAANRGSFDVSDMDGSPVGAGFAGGLHMYIAGNDTGRVYQYPAGTHQIQAAAAGPRLLSAVLDKDGTLRAAFDGTIDAGSVQPGMITIRDGHGSNTGIPLLLAGGAADSDVLTFVVPEKDRAAAAAYGDQSLHVPAASLAGTGGGPFVPDFSGGSLLAHLYRHERPFQGEEMARTESSDRYALTVTAGGNQMHVGGADGNITWYDLGTPHDITTGVRAGSDILPAYPSAGRNVVPSITGIAFSDDGMRLFAANRGDRIPMYQLGSPYDIESASLEGTLFTGFQSGIAFSDDGTRMFAALLTENAIRQYDLGSPYDIRGAGNAGQYDLDIPLHPGLLFLLTSGVHFSPDGTRMFVGEGISDAEDANANRDVNVNLWHRFDLSTPFDVLTAERVDTYEYGTGPAGDLEDLSLSPDGRRLYTLSSERVSSSEYTITRAQYWLPEPYDVTPPYHVPSFNASQGGNLADPYGMAFSPDGTRLLVAGHGQTNAKLFHLDPPFDVGTAVFHDHGRFRPGGPASEIEASGISLSADGSRIFLSDRGRGAISQYTLVAPFDVEFASDVSADSQLDVGAQDALPGGLAFSPGGTRLFMVGGMDRSVHMYSLNTPFDLGGAEHAASFGVGDRVSDPLGIAFGNGGTEMLIADTTGFVHGYSLGAPYDISGPAYSGIFDAGGSIRDVAVGGGSMFILEGETDRVYEHRPGIYPVVSALDGPALVSAAADARVGAAEALFDRAVDVGGIDPGGVRIVDAAGPLPGVVISDAVMTGEDPGVARFSLSDEEILAVSGYAEPSLVFGRHAVPGAAGGTFPSQIGNATELVASIPNPTLDFGTTLTGAAFSADGSVVFFSDGPTGRVYPYSLNIPFDISSAAPGGFVIVPVGVSDIAFSADGRNMLVADETGGIHRYLARSPYEIGTDFIKSSLGEFVETFSAAPRVQDLAGIAFSHDGMIMLAAGGSGSVHRYSLPSPYAVSGAKYEETAMIGGSPSGLEFSSDGLRMFVPDAGSETAAVYGLAAPYKIGGAEPLPPLFLGAGAEEATLSPDGRHILVPGSPGLSQYSLFSTNLELCAEPRGLDGGSCEDGIYAFESPGRGEGVSLAASITAADGPGIGELHGFAGPPMPAPAMEQVTLDSREGTLRVRLDRTVDVGTVRPYKMWVEDSDGSQTTLANSTLLNAENSNILLFRLDDAAAGKISGYASPVFRTWSSPFLGTDGATRPHTLGFGDVRLADIFDASERATSPSGIVFSEDGMGMFLTGFESHGVHEFALTHPFDITRPEYVRRHEVGNIFSADLAFTEGGSRLILLDGGGVLRSYTLGTDYDPGRITSQDGLLSLPGSPDSFYMHPDGSTMLVAYDDRVDWYQLLRPSDVRFASIESSYSLSRPSAPTGIDMSPDGRRMFISTENGVDHYLLSDPFAVATSVYLRTTPLDVVTEGIRFVDNGRGLFVAGAGGIIQRHELIDPYGASTSLLETIRDGVTDGSPGENPAAGEISLAGTFNASDNVPSPSGIEFSDDGMTMFVTGIGTPGINIFTLSAPFDITLPKHSGSTSIGGLSVSDLAFANNGNSLTVLDVDGVLRVYALGDDYNVVTGTTQKFRITLDATQGIPNSIYTSPDGLSQFVAYDDRIDLYVLGSPNDISSTTEIIPYSLPRPDPPTGMDFAPDGRWMFLSTENGIDQYLLSIPFDVSSLTYTGTITVDGVEGMQFADNGRALFLADSEGLVYSYDLEDPYALDGNTISVEFSSDGSVMYVLEYDTKRVVSYELGFPFDVSSRMRAGTLDIPQVDSPRHVAVSMPGNHLYITNSPFGEDDTIHSYGISNNDISSASYIGEEGIPEPVINGIDFSNNGRRMFLIGGNGFDYQVIHDYALDTRHDISSRRLLDTHAIPGPVVFPAGLDFSQDRLSMFIISTDGSVYRYGLDEPFIVETMDYQESFRLPVPSSADNSISDLAFGSGGLSAIISHEGLDTLYSFALAAPYGAELDAGRLELPLVGVPTGFEFSDNGSQLYIGAFRDSQSSPGTLPAGLQRYVLGVPYDPASAVFAQSLNIFDFPPFNGMRANGSLAGLHVPPDGSILFRAGNAERTVISYDMDSHDLDTLSFRESFKPDVGQSTPNIRDMDISPDGMFLYLLQGDVLDMYNLTDSYSLDAPAYAGTLDLEPADVIPRGISFSRDGTSLFMTGEDVDHIHEYALNEPWDIRNAILAGSLSISAVNGAPRGLDISEDGTTAYTMRGRDFDTGPASLVNHILPGQYSLLTDAPAFAYPVEEEGAPGDLAFSDDGMRMFVAGVNNHLRQYNLLSPYDTENAEHFISTDLLTADRGPTGLVFSDENDFFSTGARAQFVRQFTTNRPYDASTITLSDNGLYKVSVDGLPSGIRFTPDGMKMFISGQETSMIYQYSLPSPYDTSGAVRDRVEIVAGLFRNAGLSVGLNEPSPSGFEFSEDGMELYVTGSGLVHRYFLPSPYGLEDAAYGGSFHTFRESTPLGVVVRGDAMFVAGDSTDSILKYSLNAQPVGNITHADTRAGIADRAEIRFGAMADTRAEILDGADAVHKSVKIDVFPISEGITVGRALYPEDAAILDDGANATHNRVVIIVHDITEGDAPSIHDEPIAVGIYALGPMDTIAVVDLYSLAVSASLSGGDSPSASDASGVVAESRRNAVDRPGVEERIVRGASLEAADRPAVDDMMDTDSAGMYDRSPDDGPAVSDRSALGLARMAADRPVVDDMMDTDSAGMYDRSPDDGPAVSDRSALGLARMAADRPVVDDMMDTDSAGMYDRSPDDGPAVSDRSALGLARMAADRPAVDDMMDTGSESTSRLGPVDRPEIVERHSLAASVYLSGGDSPSVADGHDVESEGRRDGGDRPGVDERVVIKISYSRGAADAPRVEDAMETSGVAAYSRGAADAPRVEDAMETSGVTVPRRSAMDAPTVADDHSLARAASISEGDSPTFAEARSADTVGDIDEVDAPAVADDHSLARAASISEGDSPTFAEARSADTVGDIDEVDAPAVEPRVVPRGGGGGGGGGGSSPNRGLEPHGGGYEIDFEFRIDGRLVLFNGTDVLAESGEDLLVRPVFRPEGSFNVFDMEVLFTAPSGEISTAYYNRAGILMGIDCGELIMTDTTYSCDMLDIFGDEIYHVERLDAFNGMVISLDGPLDGTVSVSLRDSHGIPLAQHRLHKYEILILDAAENRPLSVSMDPKPVPDPAPVMSEPLPMDPEPVEDLEPVQNLESLPMDPEPVEDLEPVQHLGPVQGSPPVPGGPESVESGIAYTLWQFLSGLLDALGLADPDVGSVQKAS
ncbi:hypothetical protein CENSYa_1154 [Cenarchaeum symbiosum A]|uniref:Uncharacterized protein n=1 Tax=Cenarchaeum symbiosum (strain A) TaxID=414004 RepID=A0RWR4_CENSY|nr:hypothetical protein CENSYa_1154 [Cenarchaeum symbiosum A]